MTKNLGESRYSVYLGRGLYVGRVVRAALGLKNTIPVLASNDDVFVIDSDKYASCFERKKAIEVCHAARRSGLAAYIMPGVPA